MRLCVPVLVAMLLVSCAEEEEAGPVTDSGVPLVSDTGAGPTALDSGTHLGTLDAGHSTQSDAGQLDSGEPDIPGGGFIGSPCDDVQDCDFDNAICVTDNIMHGLCTLPCERYCPDRDGFAVTFCVEPTDIDPAFTWLSNQGACVSRCNFELYPQNGCRDGFGCVPEERFAEPDTQTHVCLPNRETQLDDCHAELMALGVNFEPSSVSDRSPSSHPDLTCHVEAPVRILSPLHGVELAYYDGRITPRVTAACAMAKALSATVLDVKAFGVNRLLHIGTYNCRVISGTNRLSRHSMGDAIDIYGFEFVDGSRATLVDDWEHDTSSPQTMAAQFLYNAAYRWHDAKLWKVILTPNYNVGHDNHFHIDLTPNSDFIQFQGTHYIGPAPYAD
jgi:hypothetical protein